MSFNGRPILNYYGGKWNIAPWIIENLPEHEIYVEPFGGAASVLLRKPRSKREIYNDLDDELYNLLKVVRDRGNLLQKKVKLTPHSRKEYLSAYDPTTGPIERARRTIVKSYFGIGDSMFQNRRTGMRTSKKSNTCVATSWKNYGDLLNEATNRLRGVSIEHLDYQVLIDKYDTKDTLFYFDPPYVRSTRSLRHCYRFDWQDQQHVDFLKRITTLKGMAVVSGYDHDIYGTLDRCKWRKIKQEFMSQAKTRRTESLWLCPKTVAKAKQMVMAL